MAVWTQGYTTILPLVVMMFLILLEAGVLVKAMYDCQRLNKIDYCRNSSRIRVTKDKKDYLVRFCTNGECMSDMVGNMNLKIRCNDVCDVCKSLPGQSDCEGNPNCEEQVDKFFDDYCNSLSVYTGTLPSTAATIEKLPAESNAECTPSSQVIGGQVSHQPILQTATGDTSSSSYKSIVAALGALLGLSVLLLALVTTGWVCTCVSMKKREKTVDNSEMTENIEQNRAAPESLHKEKNDDDEDDEEEERYFRNPTYEGTSSNKNGTSSPTYESVNLSDSTKITIENEQTYAVPDKQWQANGTYIF